MTAFVSEIMVANKTALTIFASITLFLVARKAIFLYIVSLAARTINGNLCFHNSQYTLSSLLFVWKFFYSTFFRTPPKSFRPSCGVSGTRAPSTGRTAGSHPPATAAVHPPAYGARRHGPPRRRGISRCPAAALLRHAPEPRHRPPPKIPAPPRSPACPPAPAGPPAPEPPP